MNRYLLFLFEAYYPGGGWHDFEGSFDTVKEAKLVTENKEFAEGGHLVDRDSQKIILQWSKSQGRWPQGWREEDL